MSINTEKFWPRWLVSRLIAESKTWPRVPKIRWAYIRGPYVRWEKSGAEIDTDVRTLNANRVLRNLDSVDIGLRPEYGITHLQKDSEWGVLITVPFCFYFWYQIRKQAQRLSDGAVMVNVPGSERVITFRFGKGRWDARQETYIIPTMQAGLHWD